VHLNKVSCLQFPSSCAPASTRPPSVYPFLEAQVESSVAPGVFPRHFSDALAPRPALLVVRIRLYKSQDNLQYFVPVSETSPVVKSPPNPKGRKRTFKLWIHYSTFVQKKVYLLLFQARTRVPRHSAQVSIRTRLILRTQRGCKVCST
jgi:hypothetical protein